MLYAGCVYWPFHYEHRTGLIVGVTVASLALLKSVYMILKHIIGRAT
jgi:hypothetical protein